MQLQGIQWGTLLGKMLQSSSVANEQAGRRKLRPYDLGEPTSVRRPSFQVAVSAPSRPLIAQLHRPFRFQGSKWVSRPMSPRAAASTSDLSLGNVSRVHHFFLFPDHLLTSHRTPPHHVQLSRLK